YFYSQYWQLGLVLIAALGFQHLLRNPKGRARTISLSLLGITVAACVATMAATLAFTQHYGYNDPNLQAILRGCVVLGLSAALLFRGLWLELCKERRFASVALLLIVFVDLTLYFHSASQADMNFTSKITSWPAGSPESLARIRSAWPAPRPEA